MRGLITMTGPLILWMSASGVGVSERQGDVVPSEPERVIKSSQVTVG